MSDLPTLEFTSPRPSSFGTASDSPIRDLHGFLDSVELLTAIDRVMAKATKKSASFDKILRTLELQLATLEARDEALLDRLAHAYQVLAVPVPDVSTDEVIVGDLLKDLAALHSQRKAAQTDLVPVVAKMENEVADLAKRNSVRRKELRRRARLLSSSAASSSHSPIRVSPSASPGRGAAGFRSEELREFPQQFEDAADSWASRQLALAGAESELAIAQVKFERRRRQLRADFQSKLLRIQELKEAHALSEELSALRSATQNLEDELLAVQQESERAQLKIRRAAARVDAARAALAKRRAAVSARETADAESARTLSERRKALSLLARGVADARRDVQLVAARVESVEREAARVKSPKSEKK